MKAIDVVFREIRRKKPYLSVSGIMRDVEKSKDITFSEPVNPVMWSAACQLYEKKAIQMYERKP